jgi:hypothetical protein
MVVVDADIKVASSNRVNTSTNTNTITTITEPLADTAAAEESAAQAVTLEKAKDQLEKEEAKKAKARKKAAKTKLTDGAGLGTELVNISHTHMFIPTHAHGKVMIEHSSVLLLKGT